MDIETINPYVLKIIISCRDEDSINSISQRISVSYGWAYKWIRELENTGVFKITRMNAYIQKKSSFYQKTMKYIHAVLSSDIHFYYEAIALFGITYCFTATDAVFVWTKGGYNIARYKEYYPIFIKIKKSDKKLFQWYCSKLGLAINTAKGIFYSVSYEDDFSVSYCQDVSVDSLDETIIFMKKNIYNFEPALEMVQQLYHKKINVQYQEVITNV